MDQSQTPFPLFRSPLDLAHSFWEKLLQPGDIAVDATAGNGYDTLFLARLPIAHVYSLDIQPEACQSTAQLLPPDLALKVTLLCQSHASFPATLRGAKLFVYNLGYLPGGDKAKTTTVSTTLQSLQSALSLLSDGGVISLACYPGHEEGEKEEKAILAFVSTLDKPTWCVTHTRFSNRTRSPSLVLIQKNM